MKAECDALFVFPPGLGNIGCFLPHLGVAYLQASLATRGVRTRQFVTEGPASTSQILEQILRVQPRVVGLTVYDSNYGVCLNLADRIKANTPETWVVFGGPTATFAHEYILKSQPAVDLCVRGESEEIGPSLFEKLLHMPAGNVEGLEGIPGLAFRCGGKVATSGLSPLVGLKGSNGAGLDAVTSPYLTGILKDGRAGIITGRGCTHNCVYCSFAALARRNLRLHSIDHVLAELTTIRDYMKSSGRHFYVSIHDDAFTLIPKRAKELCERIAASNLGLSLSCITRADAIDLELLQLMKEAGFYGVAFGLESAVPSVLRAIGKTRPPTWHDPDLTPEKEFIRQVRQSVLWARELGFITGVSIILGLPTETLGDARKTLQFVNDLPVDYYMHNILSVFPGTPLWENGHNLGIETGVGPLGLPSTRRLPFDVFKVKAAQKSNREYDANLIRSLAATGLYGCGAPQPQEGALNMAVIQADHMDAATANWLARYLAVSGMVMQIYSQPEMASQRRMLRTHRETLYQALVPVRFYLQMVPISDDGDCRSWLVLSEISDVFERHRPQLVTIIECSTNDPDPLIAWASRDPRLENICWLESTLRDGPRFGNTVQRLKEIGVHRLGRDFPLPPIPAYPDRWMGGRPACLTMSRIEVDSEGWVKVCRHGAKLGRIGDDLSHMFTHLEKEWANASRRRNGFMLGAKRIPECPFPGLSEEVYCRLFTDGAGEVLRGFTTLSRLKGMLVNLQDEFAVQI